MGCYFQAVSSLGEDGFPVLERKIKDDSDVLEGLEVRANNPIYKSLLKIHEP